jgi:hypothetical protein
MSDDKAAEKTEREAKRDLNSEALVLACVESGGDTCPYCGGDDVEHSEAVDTSDWQYEIERWVCLAPSCEGRHFDIEYAVDRDFVGIRTDDDDDGTLHQPAPAPARTLADRSLAFLRRVDDATLPELREARKSVAEYAEDMANKASARAVARLVLLTLRGE